MGPDRIVMLGDSLTEFNRWDRIDPDSEVLNHGLSGDTTAAMPYRLGRVGLARPDLIILQAGINDLSQGREPAEIVQSHRRIWSALSEKAPKAKLLVCSLAPLHEGKFGWPSSTLTNERVRRTNELLYEAVNEAGLMWLDLYGPLGGEEGSLSDAMTQDGVHLTAPAYELWGAVLSGWLAARAKAGG
jgi:lysophospholipase L1-like esterase